MEQEQKINKGREYFEKLIKWLKTSYEEKGGKASGRRITAMFIAVTYILARFAFSAYVVGKDKDPMLLLYGCWTDIVFIGLLWGFIRSQQLVDWRTGGSKITSTTTEPIKEEQKETIEPPITN